MPPTKKSKAAPVAAKATSPAPVMTAPGAPAAPVAAAPQRSEIKGSGTEVKAPIVREITSEQIAQRAFEIYAGRGYAPGDQDADWHEAERQLRAGL